MTPRSRVLGPDYSLPWHELLLRLTKHVFPKGVEVETWPDSKVAVIKGQGYILGRVESV